MPTAAPLVRVVRSGLVESVHLGHAVVCDPRGRVLASLGDPDRLVFSRSSMKPLQAAVSLRRIAEPLPDDLVAVMCASHNGEPVHLRVVRRLLRTGGLSERDLGCPPDLPMEPEARRAAAGPRRITHNCSGKHAGMLLACERSGAELASYLEPSHPLQREILRAVRSATGVERPVVGVDGCGAPVAAISLTGLAKGFLRASTHEVAEAMRTYPEMCSGTGRADAQLMRAVPGLFSKGGAEGVWAAAIPGIGAVAMKIDDGAARAHGPIMVSALKRLGVEVDEPALVSPPVLGRGEPVGVISSVW